MTQRACRSVSIPVEEEGLSHGKLVFIRVFFKLCGGFLSAFYPANYDHNIFIYFEERKSGFEIKERLKINDKIIIITS